MKKLKPRQRAKGKIPARLSALDEALQTAMRDADNFVLYVERGFPPRKPKGKRK